MSVCSDSANVGCTLFPKSTCWETFRPWCTVFFSYNDPFVAIFFFTFFSYRVQTSNKYWCDLSILCLLLQSCKKKERNQFTPVHPWTLKSWDQEIRSRTPLLFEPMNVVGRAVVFFREQRIKVHTEVCSSLMKVIAMHWFQYVHLNYPCISGFVIFVISRALQDLLSRERAKLKSTFENSPIHRKRIATLCLLFFQLHIKPNWGERRNVINLRIWSRMKICHLQQRCLYYKLRPFLQPFNFVLLPWSGSGVYVSFFNNIRNKTFLCFICCNLGDIFNVLQCFLICMLACSDGLQHCSSMPHWHQKT